MTTGAILSSPSPSGTDGREKPGLPPQGDVSGRDDTLWLDSPEPFRSRLLSRQGKLRDHLKALPTGGSAGHVPRTSSSEWKGRGDHVVDMPPILREASRSKGPSKMAARKPWTAGSRVSAPHQLRFGTTEITRLRPNKQQSATHRCALTATGRTPAGLPAAAPATRSR